MLRKGSLPATLPADPMPLFAEWFAHARDQSGLRNPDSMVIATSTPDGRPSARVVLLKQLVAHPGYVVFYTNYESRKGREMAANPRVAAAIHWDAHGRQVRLEGRVNLIERVTTDWIRERREVLNQVIAHMDRIEAKVDRCCFSFQIIFLREKGALLCFSLLLLLLSYCGSWV